MKAIAKRIAVSSFVSVSLTIAGAATQVAAEEKMVIAAAHEQADFDLEKLKSGLRETEALSLFAKISLRRKLEALVEDFRLFHAGRGHGDLSGLRAKFDGLVADTLARIEEDDPPLHFYLASSRTALWHTVSEPRRFRQVVADARPMNSTRPW